MHCPKCGQQQISDEIRYCSRCGFLLTGIAEVVSNAGIIPGSNPANLTKVTSPKRRGLKMGLFIFLLSFLVVPIIAIITIAVNSEEPFVVAIAAILLTMGGLLRMAYALMFESSDPGDGTLEDKVLTASQHFLKRNAKQPELPAGTTIPATEYMAPESGHWRDTNDLARPPSVTDSTTKLLQKERDD